MNSDHFGTKIGQKYQSDPRFLDAQIPDQNFFFFGMFTELSILVADKLPHTGALAAKLNQTRSTKLDRKLEPKATATTYG